MVDDNDRPTKKPRTQSSAVNANDSIALANNHVQHVFLRQNRWIQGLQEDREEGEVSETTPTAPSGFGPNRQGRQERGRASEGASEPGRGRGNRSDTRLVQYETPATLETPTMHTPRITHSTSSRSFMDAGNATARTLPSLPSPAPSDETTQSPTFTEGQLGQPGARRGYTAGTTRGRTPAEGIAQRISAPPASASASPLSGQSPMLPHTIQQQQQYMSTGVPQPSAVLLSQPQSRQRQQHHQQTQQQAPYHVPQQMPWQQGPRQESHSRLNSINTSSANMSGATAHPLRTPTVLPSNYHGHPMSPQVYAPASRRPSQELFAEISQQEQSLGQSGRLTQTNNGRLLLLKDAVEKGDWFYQILSQLFCLRSIAPDSLPQSLNGVGQKCFDMLEALLCSNRDVEPELLRFFSRFPEPIMNIYSNASGEARDQYETRLRMVRDFLTRLPTNWDGLVHRCQEMEAPPLVQDLVETLGLQSVILQTTAFRAIARMICGLGDTKGMRAIEQLHRIDQEMYYRQGWRRNPLEKNECYQRYKHTLHRWAQAAGEQRANFTTPQEVLQYFKQIPQSTLVAFQQRHQQMQQRQVQQTQAQSNMQPMSPTMHQQQQMQMQMQMQMNGQAQAQSPAMRTPSAPYPPSNTVTARPMAPPPGHQTPPLGFRSGVPFFPRPGSQPRAQPTHPDPNRSALHQAHLRSPMLGPNTPLPDAPRMYRHVVGFAVPPTKLKRAAAVQHITFTISEAMWRRLAKNEAPTNPGEPPRRTLTDQSLNFRLRCCTCPTNGFATESSWIIADNYWPDEMSFRLNGHDLETRRKLHNGRYLPIDLTEFIREGTNDLQVIFTRLDMDRRRTNFAVAVEAVGVMTQEAIKNNLKRVSAAESLNAIKKSLSGEDSGDDDDIVLTSSNMTIKLIEPYSGCNMVDIPVRGSDCLHYDCFDLEVFLSFCKRPHPGWPTVIDCWRCPICRSDVRPQMLIVDEFLLEVRQTLAGQNALDTRAIMVETDGSWKVKEEERTGVRSPSLEREERRVAAAASAPAPKKVIEIIELDDD